MRYSKHMRNTYNEILPYFHFELMMNFHVLQLIIVSNLGGL